MSWKDMVRNNRSPTGYITDCGYCSIFGCPDRLFLCGSWISTDNQYNTLMLDKGPPKHFTMDNPDCSCNECMDWATYFNGINKCRSRRGCDVLISYYGTYDDILNATVPKKSSHRTVCPADPNVHEYALHYTYWLNIPSMIHEIHENDHAPSRDSMYNKLSKKWPNINIISIDQVHA